MKNFIALLLFAILATHTAKAQGKEEQIAKSITDYFFLERENIHAQFDKTTFLSNESIWFKGYVYNRKKNVPFLVTINVYASLIDSSGKILDTKLLYGNLGMFSGSFQLNDADYPSGKYYVQFYTNWMNNFTEDESAVYEVTIINPTNKPETSFSRPSYSSINTKFTPEGGNYVKGLPVVIGVHISDCLGNPLPVTEVSLADSTNKVIKKVQVNPQGYGRIELPANTGPGLKIITSIESYNHSEPLPLPQQTGITLKVNNFGLEGKTLIEAATNTATVNSFGGKPAYMVIHQDDKVTALPLNFTDKSLTQTIAIADNELHTGVNTIRILDNDMRQLAERLIYKFPTQKVTSDFQKAVNKYENYEIQGKTSTPLMNLSVTVLPDNSLMLKNPDDIYGALQIAPYIDNKLNKTGRYYYSNISRKSRYEIDLMLLNTRSKYNWNTIVNNPPKQNNIFDIGLTLKGTVNQNISNPEDYKVRVFSKYDMIDEMVSINEKKEFYLNHLILADSSKLNFALVKKGVENQKISIYPQITNNNRKFNKSYKPSVVNCVMRQEENSNGTDIPRYNDKIVELDEVEVSGKSRAFKYAKVSGNGQLRPYKITPAESRSFIYLTDYIRYQGFNVSTTGGSVSITGRSINTINGQATRPRIYFNNFMLKTFDDLLTIYTEDVEELYVNQHAPVPGVDNEMGIIRIYMKTNFAAKQKDEQETTYIVKNGFKRTFPFKNAQYMNTFGKGFENYGIIDWQPYITSDEKGNFSLKIPMTAQKKINLLIEGMGADGRLISEIKTIDLE